MAQFQNIYPIDLNIKKKGAQELLQPIGEGDANGVRVGAQVFADGAPVTLNGQCVAKVIRADGSTVPLTGTISGNIASVALDQQSCAVEGPIQVAVIWVSGTNVTTLVIAYGTIVNTISGTIIQPSTPIPDLTQLLAEIDAMRQATAAANAAATKAVRYNEAQSLTDTEKARARGNISAPSAADLAATNAELAALADGKAVRYDTAQTLVPSKMRQGRDNLNAAETMEGNIAGSYLINPLLFQRGSLDQGNITTAQYRVVTKHTHVFSFPVTFIAQAGFRFSLDIYTNDGYYYSTVDWTTTNYTLAKNQNFRMTIARVTDIASETADIDAFASGVHMLANQAAVVHYNVTQTLTAAERKQARDNIGAPSAADLAAEAAAREAADSDLKSALNQMPFRVKTFTVNAHTAHLSTSDKIDVDIKAGQPLYFETSAGFKVIGHSDGTKVQVYDTYFPAVEKDIVYLGIYYNNTSDEAKEITFAVATSPIGYPTMELQNDVSTLQNDVSALQNDVPAIIALNNTTNNNADTFDKHLALYCWGSTTTMQNVNDVRIGNLYNINGGNTYRQYQIITDVANNKQYYRARYGDNWKPWKQFVTTDEVESIVGPFQIDIENLKGAFSFTGEYNQLYYDDGHAINHAQYNATDLIPIEVPFTCFFSANVPSGFHAFLVYDASMNVIDTYFTGNQTNQEYTITNSNAKYIRFQGRNLDFPGNTTAPMITIYRDINGELDSLTKKIEQSDKIVITKVNGSKFNLKVPCKSGNVVRYEFTHDVKVWDSLEYIDGDGNTQTATNVLSADFWNNYEVYNDTTGQHIAQGHSNFICNENNHYVGDGHGCEVQFYFKLILDGKFVDIETMAVGASIECGEARIIENSYVYRCAGYEGSNVPSGSYPALDTDGKPVLLFIHSMEISYEIGNRVVINNKLNVKQNNVDLHSCYGAMLENYFANFNTVIVNNDEHTMNYIGRDGTVTVPDGNTINLRKAGAVFANRVEMFGDNHYIRQTMLIDDPTKRHKAAVNFTFYENRLKCYFAPIATRQRYPSGQTPDILNAGDVISVTDERIIEI